MVLVEVLAHSDELAKRLSSKRMSFEDTQNGVDIRNKLKEVGMCLELKRYKCYSQLTMKYKGIIGIRELSRIILVGKKPCLGWR